MVALVCRYLPYCCSANYRIFPTSSQPKMSGHHVHVLSSSMEEGGRKKGEPLSSMSMKVALTTSTQTLLTRT